MKCSDVRKMLTDYLDGILNERDKALVEEHLASCKACAEEFAFLKAYVEETGSLEKMKAPEDFLEKVHQRLERRFSFEKLMRTLFVPARIKIPLELAGVAATILVAFFIARFVMFEQGERPLMLAKQPEMAVLETIPEIGEMAKTYRYDAATTASPYEPSTSEGFADYDMAASGGISGMNAAYYMPDEFGYEKPAEIIPVEVSIEDIQWELVEVYGEEVPLLEEGRQPFLRLNAGTKQVGGYTGCNNFFGEYELKGESIAFGPLGMTYRFCDGPQGQVEKSFIEALDETRTWQIDGEEFLLLDDDNVLARFK